MGGNSLIDRLFKRESTTKEEIRQLVDEDQAKGELEASQREMIHNIFDVDRLCAEDIMTHRTEIEAVEETATIGYAAAFALEAGCSRIPVFREDLDNVQGILYVKDLLPFVGKPVPVGTRLTDYVREPLFVPESIPCGSTVTQKIITKLSSRNWERKEKKYVQSRARHYYGGRPGKPDEAGNVKNTKTAGPGKRCADDRYRDPGTS